MFAFMITLLWGLLTGHASTYSYPNGQAGIVVRVDGTHCEGFELAGEFGPFSNLTNPNSGDCS